MPFIGSPDDKMVVDIHRVAEKILVVMRGEKPDAVAAAALHVAVGIWAVGGVTNEQAKIVAGRAIDVCIKERNN